MTQEVSHILDPAAVSSAASEWLLMAMALACLFGLVSPSRAPHPLAVVVISVIVMGWLFVATLIWGTDGPWRLRWGLEPNVWGCAVLLGLTAAGVLAAAAALRCFADQKTRAGWAMAMVFASAFTWWSAAMRYSVGVAIFVLTMSLGALGLASTMPAPPEVFTVGNTWRPSVTSRAEGWLWNGTANALPLLSAPVCFWLLELGPVCGWPAWIPWMFIPLLAVPGITAWIRTWRIGSSRQAVAAAAGVAVAVSVAGCIFASFAWFGVNGCGE